MDIFEEIFSNPYKEKKEKEEVPKIPRARYGEIVRKVDSQEVIRLYKEGMSPRRIGEKLGVYANLVRRIIKKSGLSTRGRAQAAKAFLRNKKKGNQNDETQLNDKSQSPENINNPIKDNTETNNGTKI